MPARCSRARKPTGHRWGRVSGRSPSCLYVAIPEVAADGIQRRHETTRDGGTDWGLGIAARCGALLSEGDAAELLYREAIERFWRTRLRPELARAHLLYGEWLRREGRRAAAREQLHIAHEMFTGIGMEGFADRAHKELLATGAKARKRTVETRDDLTAQERQIGELARDGLSNPEIGARLFLRPRTVEWHLRKVFGKLGIRSRHELAGALARPEAELVQA
jgi:DNA-binding CsgD family transcriptional regulator